jgi:polysaccharide biosynthesis/export protein VpsN
MPVYRHLMTRLLTILVLRGFLFSLGLVALWTQAEELEVSSSYTLNTGDHIKVTVYEESDLSINAVLDDSGAISYPLLGEVKVRGLTARQLEQKIAEGLRGRFLINPRVNVSIAEYRPFFVRGEVASPGGYAFKPGLTVEKAVSLAGGFTSRASKSKFYIVSDDKQEGRAAAKLDTRVRPGDVIHIEQSFF